MEITFASEKDIRSIHCIEQTCFPKLEAASEMEIRNRFLAFPENFLVAKMETEVVGFITGGTSNNTYLPDAFYHDPSLHDASGKYQTVFSLAVLPKYQNNGIASNLMKSFVSLASTRHKEGMILTCKEHLIPYYQKFGFDCKGVSKSLHGNTTWYDMFLKL